MATKNQVIKFSLMSMLINGLHLIILFFAFSQKNSQFAEIFLEF
ncbi:hypothetical protein BGP_2820 [Beggiatoa sp. PS]|nr:hypothetical protein BGP_2820 [Beggiatoa sp. PS]